jgi:hypothetical protein
VRFDLVAFIMAKNFVCDKVETGENEHILRVLQITNPSPRCYGNINRKSYAPQSKKKGPTFTSRRRTAWKIRHQRDYASTQSRKTTCAYSLTFIGRTIRAVAKSDPALFTVPPIRTKHFDALFYWHFLFVRP